MNAKQLFAALLSLLPLAAVSQEQLGLRLDNFAGVNGMLLNPAAHSSSPFSWDVNLLEGGQFVANNYAFLRDTRVLDLLKPPNDLDIIAAPDLNDENNPPNGVIVLDYDNDGRRRFANITTTIMGPSFFVRLNERNTIGLYTRARFMGEGHNVSNNLSYYIYYDRKFGNAFPVEPFRFSLLGWSELALNYMHTVPTDNGRLSLGVSAKYLQGYESIYLRNEEQFMLTKLPGDSLSGSPIDFNFGFTTSNLIDGGYSLQRNGGGFGLDLGLVYLVSEYDEGYRWKFGVALLDIGQIAFTRNTQKHRVRTTEQTTIGTIEYHDFNSLADFEDKIRLFSEQTLQDPGASLVAENFNIWLPAALSLQVDYAFSSNLYLGAALIQGLPVGEVRSQRGGLLAVVPRYEHRWLGASLPVSVYNWRNVRVGMALRLAVFTLGTDNLGSIVNRSNLSGTDFYFAVKVHPFGTGGEKDPRKTKIKSGKNRVKTRGGGGAKCYRF
jgi:hypothetical protein